MKLEARGISFRYEEGERQILNRASVTLESGERVGLMAPSGFGKTTLCRILAGYERPERGEVLLDGKPLVWRPGQRMPVQLIWQHPEQAVDPRWRMKEILREGGSPKPELLLRLGIREEWMERYPQELSGGELQRFCIARALGAEPRFLLADEITAMLDPVNRSLIWKVLLEEAERRGLGLLVVSHSERLLSHICTRRIGAEDLVLE